MYDDSNHHLSFKIRAGRCVIEDDPPVPDKIPDLPLQYTAFDKVDNEDANKK